MKRIIAAMCAALCTVSLFSCGSSDTNGGEGHMYSVALKGNPQSLDPQFAEDESSATVIKNLYSGLMQTDKDGNLSVCTASDYNVSADGLVYTFDLREDNYWFFDENDDDVIDDGEYFPVTAADYVFALKRLLDPQMKSPYAKDFACIKNGEKILSGQLSPDDSGIVAKSDTQLEITLDYPCAEFLKLLSTQAAFPCNEEFFLSTKGRYGLDDRSVMSNGPFYVRQWFYDPYGSNNILYMRKNSANVCESYEVLPSYVSFSIEEGQIVGIVGKNGSGKSTMLRSIAGVFSPNSGSIDIHGRSISLLSIGVGFERTLSGRENIYLSGLLLGFSKEQIREREESIITFSELGDFIDKPVSTYSSGMYSKLAFSITAILETDIMLIDEVLSVGDVKFKRKSYEKMKELIQDDRRTVLIVSHSSETIRNLCSKVLWLHDGELKRFGETEEVLAEYEAFMNG